MLYTEVNSPTTLSLLLSDGRTDLYGQARVYSSGVLSATVNLNHAAEGLYVASYTPATEGVYTVVYEAYADVGRTVPTGYGKGSEGLDVGSYRTNILRLLGLAHENSVIDSQVWDTDSNLTSARIRCYDSAANAAAANAIAPAAYNTGLRFSYSVSASYSGGLLSKYAITRNP